jgi:hypothetical protein
MMLGEEVWLIEPVGTAVPATPEVIEPTPVATAPAKGSLVPA